MKVQRKWISIVILTGVVLTLAAYGGGGGGSAPPTDNTPPTATVLPGSGSTIGGSMPIVLTFNESMSAASLALSGDMAAESDGGIWSATNRESDTLTVRPNTSWNGGSGRTLTIDAADSAGNPLASLTLTYDVDTTPPAAAAAPSSGSTISSTRQIVIAFTEAMDPASLGLGGTLAPASDGGVWSSATYANDTLTISPVSVWSNGAGTLTVNVADRVGNPLAALNVSFTVDATLPTAGVSPANGSILANTTQIVITFSESMDTGTLSVSGMDAKSSTWSTTVVANDTLTIRPATEWGVGTNRSLSVYAKDLVGNPITVSLVYDVAIVYVRDSDGSDSNPGARTQPMKTISAAIARADSLYTKGRVLVAGGTYSVSTAIALVEGISLFGGYSPASWDVRDYQTYVTTIQDTRTTGGTDFNPNRTIEAGNGIAPATVVDGFVIKGGGGASAAVFSYYGSPTIRNNTIQGGTGATVYGVFNYSASSSVIENNVINAGTAGAGSYAYGVWNFGAGSPVIRNNTISGGVAGQSAYAVQINSVISSLVEGNTIVSGKGGINSVGIWVANTSSAQIRNNTIAIVTGATGSQYAVRIQSGPITIRNNTIQGEIRTETANNPIIENNILFTPTDGGFCITDFYAVASLRNNDFVNCYYYLNGSGTLTTISAIEAALKAKGSAASGNVSASPAFANQAGGDWHLTASSPTSVSRGGLDLSAQFTTDKDGASRTAPWSIGAYERD
ncbi:MAG: Ig-like domain-containing protein [Nitrospirota bacterium]